MNEQERERIIDGFARALYASAFQQPIEDSSDVAEAWRVWREEAAAILDEALIVSNKERRPLREAGADETYLEV